MTSPHYIIWDLDGTLLNTLKDLYLAVNHALTSFGMPQRSMEEVRQFVGNGVRRLMVLAVPDGEANPQFEACFAEFKTYYTAHCKENTCLYPGLNEALAQLHHLGIPMAIVSNKLQAGVDELHHEWFSGLIDVAIGEREGVRRKPAPDMVLEAMRRLGATPEECIYVGDSEVDIATARAAGIACISVTWGFRSADFLAEAGATAFAHSPEDILRLVRP